MQGLRGSLSAVQSKISSNVWGWATMTEHQDADPTVDPNAHKRRKLRKMRDVYQKALADAFDAGSPHRPKQTM